METGSLLICKIALAQWRGGEKVKIRVRHNFKDIEEGLRLRTVGEILTVSEERGKYLISMKVAELAEEKGGDPESPSETQG